MSTFFNREVDRGSSSTRLNRLINRLMGLTRLTSGLMELTSRLAGFKCWSTLGNFRDWIGLWLDSRQDWVGLWVRLGGGLWVGLNGRSAKPVNPLVNSLVNPVNLLVNLVNLL